MQKKIFAFVLMAAMAGQMKGMDYDEYQKKMMQQRREYEAKKRAEREEAEKNAQPVSEEERRKMMEYMKAMLHGSPEESNEDAIDYRAEANKAIVTNNNTELVNILTAFNREKNKADEKSKFYIELIEAAIEKNGFGLEDIFNGATGAHVDEEMLRERAKISLKSSPNLESIIRSLSPEARNQIFSKCINETCIIPEWLIKFNKKQNPKLPKEMLVALGITNQRNSHNPDSGLKKSTSDRTTRRSSANPDISLNKSSSQQKSKVTAPQAPTEDLEQKTSKSLSAWEKLRDKISSRKK